MTYSQILSTAKSAHQHHQTLVLATGVFDLLHQEHVNFLQKAHALGDVLIVGLESDVRVKQLKGPDRPINSQTKRLQHILALNLTPYIFILPQNFSTPSAHRRLISDLTPTYLAVSSHTPHLDKKRALLSEYNGQVIIVHQKNPAISTTQLLNSQA